MMKTIVHETRKVFYLLLYDNLSYVYNNLTDAFIMFAFENIQDMTLLLCFLNLIKSVLTHIIILIFSWCGICHFVNNTTCISAIIYK